MRGKPTNLLGQRFGKLVVVEFAGLGRNGKQKARQWLCRCDCGAETVVLGTRLMRGRTKSCGCRVSEAAKKTRERLPALNYRHGHSHSPTYRSWYAMIQRCTNPRNRRYADYGGRGIEVCSRWRMNFAYFLADMGERPDGMTIDREDVDGHYEPGNCRWATAETQARNKRSSKPRTEGETQCAQR